MYQRIKGDLYYASRVVAFAGMLTGMTTQLIGAIRGDDDMVHWGAYIALPSIGYFCGTKVGEKQFMKKSDLEKKMD